MNSKIVKIIIGLLFVAAIGAGGYKGYTVNKSMEAANKKAVVSFQDMNEASITNTYHLKSDEKVKNILLVGADKRGGESGYGRSDCMMIASIDTKNSQLKLTSLMGDMYVNIPGYGENRLSMAYSIGGISLLYETIASNLGVQLDNYAILEFNSFVSVIDQVDGVTIEITEAEAKYLQEHYTNAAREVVLGNNVLNGTQALAYVRIKQDAIGDYGRIRRQRKIMKALYSKLSTMSVSDLVPIVTKLLEDTSTDISLETMKSYLASVVALSNTEILEKTVPLDGEYVTQALDGVLVYQIDTNECQDFIQDFIYNPVTKENTSEESKK